MTLLLDTHTFLWFCQDDPLLSATAKALIEDPAHRKLVSVASCWEIAIKAGLGKLVLGEPSGTYIPAALSRTGFELLPISLTHATHVETLPPHHRDPFDRLLIAQAMIESIPIVSVDVALDPYRVSRLWLRGNYTDAGLFPFLRQDLGPRDGHWHHCGVTSQVRTPAPLSGSSSK